MDELNKCLKCLYLSCDESVADDVNMIVRAAITASELRGAKAMQEAAIKAAKGNWANDRDGYLPEVLRPAVDAIRAIDPSTVGGGGG